MSNSVFLVKNNLPSYSIQTNQIKKHDNTAFLLHQVREAEKLNHLLCLNTCKKIAVSEQFYFTSLTLDSIALLTENASTILTSLGLHRFSTRPKKLRSEMQNVITRNFVFSILISYHEVELVVKC